MALRTLITRKVGMTSTIDENGVVKAVTLLSFNEHTVISVKNTEKDGYAAIQVGTETAKKMNKSIIGHVKNSKVMPKIIREFRLKDDSENITNVGDKLSADVFSIGDLVDVSGLNKGKGWAGTIKRHNFKRGRKTHGGRSYRRVGSIGSMYPQHVFKGKKMPGQMGHVQTTVKNLKVALIDTDLNVIGVYGAVPGPKKAILMVKGVK
ncbi:MAG: 50S ribosomal protein L3 [bacterium]|jgi:large subunit ribosomal protein L3|nr:50S ribosomal protein L3 [bacterium]